MEDEEDMKEEVDTEAKEAVEDHFVEEEDRSSAITVDTGSLRLRLPHSYMYLLQSSQPCYRRLSSITRKIQEKQQSQNFQLIGIEQQTTDPTVNVLTRSGPVTGGQPSKPRGEWVRKVEDKQPIVDLDKIKEKFMHACT